MSRDEDPAPHHRLLPIAAIMLALAAGCGTVEVVEFQPPAQPGDTAGAGAAESVENLAARLLAVSGDSPDSVQERHELALAVEARLLRERRGPKDRDAAEPLRMRALFYAEVSEEQREREAARLQEALRDYLRHRSATDDE